MFNTYKSVRILSAVERFLARCGLAPLRLTELSEYIVVKKARPGGVKRAPLDDEKPTPPCEMDSND